MNSIIDKQHIFTQLGKTWQPVAVSRDLPMNSSVSVTLLDQELIIARLPGGLLAGPDRCPHRGAKFGLGDIHNGHLRCPYHGWEFDHHGSCQKIPSLHDQQHHARQLACLHHYAIQERYGMIWVRLDNKEAAPLPDIPEFESADWEYVIADPMYFGVGFRREVDNYLDMSHFAFAHGSSLGVAAQEIIEHIRITHYRDGLQMDAPFPFLQSSEIQAGKLQQAHHRCQRIYLPNFTTIRQSFNDGDERILVHIPSPHSEESCTVYWALAINKGFDGPPIADQISFAIRVLSEDKLMVENQRPLEVPLGAEEGVNVPADRLPIAYKRAFREFVEQKKMPPAAPSFSSDGPHPLAICWGSQTGNAERLANTLQFACEDAGIGSDVRDLATLHPDDLQQYKLTVIISSTYGKGEAPDNAKEFYQALQKSTSDAFQELSFAVCGLGDRRYPHFCQCAKDFDKLFEAAGAQRFLERLDCEADYAEQFNAWALNFVTTVERLLRTLSDAKSTSTAVA